MVYLLLLPAFLLADKALRWLYGGGLLILLVAEVALFQPNPYDNNKLLFQWHLLGCLLVANLIVTFTRWIGEHHRAAAVVCCAGVIFMATFGSVLTLGREAVSQYQHFSTDDIALAAWEEENIPADALCLTGTHHQNATASLAGRPILCGSTLYVYYHGTNYQQQEQAVRTLYEAPTEDLLARWNVQYAVITPAEQHTYAVDNDFYRSRYPMLYNQNGYTVFDTRSACAA